MQNNFIKSAKLFTDKDFVGKNIGLENVSHSKIRGLKILGETIGVGEGEKSPQNPYKLYSCENPVIKVCDINLANPQNVYCNGNIVLDSLQHDAESNTLSGTVRYSGTRYIGYVCRVKPNTIYYLNDFEKSELLTTRRITFLSDKPVSGSNIIDNTVNVATGGVYEFTTPSDCNYVIVGGSFYDASSTLVGDVWIKDVMMSTKMINEFEPYTEQSQKLIGKNILDFRNLSMKNNTLKITSDEKGVVNFDGESPSSYHWQIDIFKDIEYYTLKKGKRYFLSIKYLSGEILGSPIGSKTGTEFNILFNNGKSIHRPFDNGQNYTYSITPTEDQTITRILFTTPPAYSYDNYRLSIQLERGESVTEFEPYKDQYKLSRVGNVHD